MVVLTYELICIVQAAYSTGKKTCKQDYSNRIYEIYGTKSGKNLAADMKECAYQ